MKSAKPSGKSTWSFRPSKRAAGAGAGHERQGHADLNLAAGIDAKYGITANLTADVTVKTDFAQVEVDDQQVNGLFECFEDRFVTVPGGGNYISVAGKLFFQQFEDLGFVVCNQDMGGAHGW